MRTQELALPLTKCCRPFPLPGWNWPWWCENGWARPRGIRPQLAPFLAVYCIGWASWGNNTGDFTWVVMMRETWQTDQPSHHTGSEPGLWGSPLQRLSHLWIAGACEGRRNKKSKTTISPWHKISIGYSRGVPLRAQSVSRVKQKTESLYQTNDSLKWILIRKDI